MAATARPGWLYGPCKTCIWVMVIKSLVCKWVRPILEKIDSDFWSHEKLLNVCDSQCSITGSGQVMVSRVKSSDLAPILPYITEVSKLWVCGTQYENVGYRSSKNQTNWTVLKIPKLKTQFLQFFLQNLTKNWIKVIFCRLHTASNYTLP